jgi:hypothetical protein
MMVGSGVSYPNDSVDAYADLDSYQETTEREIPVIILQPC